jgi:hypothetical protein
MHIYFSLLTGISEVNLLKIWRETYTKNNLNSSYINENSLVQKFHQLVLLSPIYFILLLRLAPSIAAARCLVQSGMVLINGESYAAGIVSIKPGDLVQINPVAIRVTRRLFTFQVWKKKVKSVINLQFLYID